MQFPESSSAKTEEFNRKNSKSNGEVKAMESKEKLHSTFLALMMLAITLPLFLLLAFPSTASESNLTANSSQISEAQLTEANAFWNLDIYKDRVVWSDANNWDIYLYNISTDNKTQITDDSANQWYVAIYEDRIIWDDDRNGNWDIYMYNISTQNETRITSNASDQTCPVIFGDMIAWEDYRNGNGDKNSDIYIYNISTHKETQITANEALQEKPFFYKDRIVWMDSRNGGIIAGYGKLAGNWDIYMYNLSTAQETQISNNEFAQMYPDIYEDRIVWADYRNDSWPLTKPEIYIYNLSSSTETRLTTNSSCSVPAVYEDRIVWEYGQEEGDEDFDIYMYNLSISTETQITTDESYQGNPAVYGDRIVWRDERNGGSYIYMYAPGLGLPRADFSASPVTGNLPLKVKFIDLSKGEPTKWQWSFGDGNTSTAKNPEHTYYKAEDYTVTLKTTNKEGMDSETKVDYIHIKNDSRYLEDDYLLSALSSEFLNIYSAISELIISLKNTLGA